MSALRAIHSRLASSQAVAYKVPWASAPLALELLRFGTIQVQAAAPSNFGGAKVKVQGSNVGIGVSPETVAATGRQLDAGGINPTDLGWIDLGFETVIPPGVNASAFVPGLSGAGASVTWDVNWIRLVVTAGPSGIVLDAWAKFKSGGG